MKNNTLVISAMTAAALLGIGSMFHVQRAEASPRMMMADNGMDMKGMDMKGMNMEAAPATHSGTGTVKKIDAAKGVVTLAHGPIASLRWPAMTMSFELKDAALAKGIKVGDAVDFELVRSQDSYVITRLHLSGK
jgi:Cu/Ag efflux protein CusF